MNKTLLVTGVFMLSAFASQSALADFRVRASVASSSYQLGGDYITAKSDYTPVGLGLTYAADNGFYVDVAASGGEGEHDGWTNFGAPSEKFNRTDIALIVGGSKLNPNNGIAGTFYAGLKSGTTTLGAQNTGLSWTEETLTTSGLVLGGGVSFPIASGRAGAVGVNLGLGLMASEWKDDAGFSAKSDTAIGGSLGVSYTLPITSMLGMMVDYKINSYEYNFGDAATPFTVTEDISTLTATAYLKF